jgi:DNA invertase Pin-like site-specific DNA recombinase
MKLVLKISTAFSALAGEMAKARGLSIEHLFLELAESAAADHVSRQRRASPIMRVRNRAPAANQDSANRKLSPGQIQKLLHCAQLQSSSAELAIKFSCSASTVQRILRNYRATEHLAPSTIGKRNRASRPLSVTHIPLEHQRP